MTRQYTFTDTHVVSFCIRKYLKSIETIQATQQAEKVTECLIERVITSLAQLWLKAKQAIAVI